jgi:D-alanyl-D-alanine carboxypeptidase
MPGDAQARSHHKRPHIVRKGGGYSPPFAAMVVDANTGKTLYAVDVDEPRHPASITKVMTLYLLFEQLERGTISLDTEFRVSSHAAAQAPSRLGIRPGGTITVEDAIKAVVTKSANDIAVTIAENVGGSEEDFAERMTRKARQLGMTGTTYRNASGLPNPNQITTAKDLTILARAIQERFPKYYRYFQTRSFAFNGQVIGNHNRLIGRVEGVDGIKTGFTNASGFNLMTSARLDGHHVVGVILGGRSTAARDNQMADLIRSALARSYAGAPTSSVLADAGADRPVETARTRVADVETTATARATRPTDSSAMRPAVAPVPGGSATTPSTLKWMNGAAAAPLPPTARAYASASPDLDFPAPTPPSSGQKIDARLPAAEAVAPRAEPVMPPVRNARLDADAEPKREIAKDRDAKDTRDIGRSGPASGWVIQLAAASDEGEARAILSDARSRSGRVLADAKPFTEKVVRGGSTLYRARFSGFDEPDSAQEACRSLKTRGFSCFATRS